MHPQLLDFGVHCECFHASTSYKKPLKQKLMLQFKVCRLDSLTFRLPIHKLFSILLLTCEFVTNFWYFVVCFSGASTSHGYLSESGETTSRKRQTPGNRRFAPSRSTQTLSPISVVFPQNTSPSHPLVKLDFFALLFVIFFTLSAVESVMMDIVNSVISSKKKKPTFLG